MQPRAKRSIRIEPIGATVELEEHFLRRVPCVFPSTEQPVGGPQNQPFLLLDRLADVH